MKKGLFLSLYAGAALWGADVDTKVLFGSEDYAGEDKYGNALYERDITIQTTDYKVDNYWKKFALDGKKEDAQSFDIVQTKGRVRITLEGTSACLLDNTLASEGCSGQKPFLINDEVLQNPMSGTEDRFEVAFTEAAQFSNSDQYGFYPLDILRDAQYYQDPNPEEPEAPNKGFFSFFTSAFDFIFSKTIGFGSDFFGKADIADVEYTPRSDEAEDRRQRYIANIIAGVEQNRRMTKPTAESAGTQINSTVNTPVSLLHYGEAKKTTENEQCKMMFLTLSNDGLMCRMMGGFGMDAWMPFFNQTQTTEIQSSYILGDTENALLAMTGKIQNVPYMEDIGGDDNSKISFLQQMLKPMTTMISIMKSMMFGSSKASTVEDPAERVYEFSEAEAMTLTFALTNEGTQVDDFENFQLLKIRSAYGDAINSCRVKKKPGMMSWSSWDITFYEGGTVSKDGKTSDEWIAWCQGATENKGMFDYLFDWSSGAMFNPINWMKSMFSSFLQMFFGSYDIKDFQNKVARGLILELKKVQPDPVSPLNTRKVELISIGK